MAIVRPALELICSFEGYHRQVAGGLVVPYYCPAHVPTIGFGSIYRLDGSRVEMTDPPIDRDMAMALMMRELVAKCEPAVSRMITVPMHSLMRGALVSFAYNCGAGALRASGLRRSVNDRRWADVPAELAKWRMGGGRVQPGLVRRRAAEAAMFMDGVRQLASGRSANDNVWLATVARAA